VEDFCTWILVKNMLNKTSSRRTLDQILQVTITSIKRTPCRGQPWSSQTADNIAAVRIFVTFSVMQSWCHHAIKWVNCRVFIPVSTGAKIATIAREMPANIMEHFYGSQCICYNEWLFTVLSQIKNNQSVVRCFHERFCCVNCLLQEM